MRLLGGRFRGGHRPKIKSDDSIGMSLSDREQFDILIFGRSTSKWNFLSNSSDVSSITTHQGYFQEHDSAASRLSRSTLCCCATDSTTTTVTDNTLLDEDEDDNIIRREKDWNCLAQPEKPRLSNKPHAIRVREIEVNRDSSLFDTTLSETDTEGGDSWEQPTAMQKRFRGFLSRGLPWKRKLTGVEKASPQNAFPPSEMSTTF
jgi:hypothetical protein